MLFNLALTSWETHHRDRKFVTKKHFSNFPVSVAYLNLRMHFIFLFYHSSTTMQTFL